MKRMIKIILIIYFLILFTDITFAQLTINKGVKGGLNISSLSLKPKSIFEFSNYPGTTVGLYLELDILGPINFIGEILFSQKGAKFKTSTQEVKVHINYIDIPILFELSIPFIPTTSFIIQSGPYLSYKLNEDWQPSDYYPESNFFKNSDYGIAFSGGLKIKTYFTDVIILARYSFGMANIEQGDVESKNRNIAFTFSFSF